MILLVLVTTIGGLAYNEYKNMVIENQQKDEVINVLSGNIEEARMNHEIELDVVKFNSASYEKKIALEKGVTYDKSHKVDITSTRYYLNP